jgi:UDP-N-acetyl-D-mannosaminuronate dehydrogenase
MDMPVLKDLPTLDGVDVIVFTVGHRDYHQLSLTEWLADQDVAVFDANNVLSRVQRDELRRLGTKTQYIGRGEAIA